MSRRYPEIRIVVDHLGRPVPGCGADHPEFNSLLGLAEEQNIYLKISGMYYYSLESQPFGDTLPMIQNAIRAFGARRCLWGSDFPFIMDRWSYSSLLDAIREYKFLSEEDLDWLLGRTSESLWWNE
jgi:predicted TIM-barrel fold metal-dependent hydrolase